VGVRRAFEGELWVAPDHHGPALLKARIVGPGVVHLAEEMSMRRRPLGHGFVAKAAGRLSSSHTLRRSVELGAGESLEVRP
jgi:hypothetical protein